MTDVELRIDARWIVPIEPDTALAQHALAIDDGRIVGILSQAEADRSLCAKSHLRFPEHALLPGLVNAHTHGAMTLLRGIADDLPLKNWLEHGVWPREARVLGPDFVRDGALLAAAEMLKGGITCCNDMYFYPDASAEAYARAGMRAMLGMPVLEFATPYAANATECLQAGLAARDNWKHESRFSFSFAPHAPYTVGDATWEKIVVYARQLDLPIQTHLHETKQELVQSLEQFGMSPLARLQRLGATGPGFIAIHAVHVDDDTIETLAEQGCQIVHCPISNAKLGSGVAPVVRLQERGINVALGTDGAASNNRLDLFGEMRIASLLAKVTGNDAAALPAAAALSMATLGGARALGLDRSIGSLVPGKEADVIAVDLGALELRPCYDPISHLVNAAGREHVTDVWIRGRRIVEGRTLTTLDVGELAALSRLWHDRLQWTPG